MAFKIEDNSWPDFHNLRFSRHFVQSRNKHYSLSTLKSYVFYAETLPVLEKALVWPIEKIVRIIGFSLLLNDEMLDDLTWLDNKVTFCSFFSLDKDCSDYEISVVKDFVIFQNSCNHSYHIEEIYEFETDLFKNYNMDYMRSSYYQVASNLYLDGGYEFFHFMLTLKMPSELTQELLYDYLNVCDSRLEFDYGMISSLFYKELNDVYKNDIEITPYTLSSKLLIAPLVFCFLVAYVKANNLFSINNDMLVNNLHPHYILAFRDFWWKCEVYGNNKDTINQQIKSRKFDSKDSSVLELWDINGDWDGYVVKEKYKQFYEEDNLRYLFLDKLFSIGTEMSYRYDVYSINLGLNGIDLKMNNDYMNPENLLFKNVIPPKEPILNEHFAALVAKEGNISVSNEYCKKSEDESGNGVANHNCSDTNEEEKEKMRLMCSILSPDIDKEKADEIFSILRSMVEGGKGKRMVTIMLGAIKAGLINVRPTYNEWVKLGFNFGKDKGYYKILKEVTDDNKGTYHYRKYPEIDVYCERLMLIKAKYSNNRDSSLS